ncbi:hypothetical protein GQ53DRAFT_748104 [Thozetella sp. PMI_491]|nr:hypothetical protein GQ53DRAFT_748104 [Thozetella sp. PMI_491]
MSLYSEPPPLHAFRDDKPTLLVCWWITVFCTAIILLRVCGRFVRTERLFTEDKTAALALIPLYLRMACVHVILLYGTNNAQLAGAKLSEEDIAHKQLASGLVLLSRLFYAATLWILKNTILEFFKRLNANWQRTYGLALLAIRCLLLATFVAVVIADLAECTPFSDYWRLYPEPPGQCRQGYVQLLTMAVCNVITDLCLVFFPIPIIIQSHMSAKRKVHLVLLFSLSLIVVATTLYRVPHIFQEHGSQQSRSLYASVELLFATAAANVLVLGSFVRDRGIKKRKYKHGSVATGSMERPSETYSRRPTIVRHWGSDEDLVRDVGFGVDRDLQDMPAPTDTRKHSYTPAPVARFNDMKQWNFPGQKRASVSKSDDTSLHHPLESSRSDSTATPSKRVSFFDVGGLLEEGALAARHSSLASENLPPSPTSLPPLSVPASGTGLRRGSTAFLQDVGSILGPLSPRPARSMSRTVPEVPAGPRSTPAEPAVQEAAVSPPPAYPTFVGRPELVLKDPGGLLR